MSSDRHRLYAALLALGASVLLARTIIMLAGGALAFLALWVSGLLMLELVLDAATLGSAIRWWVTGSGKDTRLALRLAAAATMLHAFRVLVFVLGRTGPWIDFDVQPAQRAFHAARWTWGEVYFAAVLSVLGVVGVIVIWRIRRRRLRSVVSTDPLSRLSRGAEHE